MQLTKEKLSYLLFLYKQREMDYTVTRLAQEVGVSKSTFSRVLNTFYQEGLTTEKGKGILSCQGCRMAREYLKDINKLSDWLKYPHVLCLLFIQKHTCYHYEIIIFLILIIRFP